VRDLPPGARYFAADEWHIASMPGRFEHPAEALLDPELRTLDAAARIVHRAHAAVALTRAGETLPLPGLPAHPLLDPDSAVLAVASAHLAARHDTVTFLCPSSAGDTDPLQRITVLGGISAGHLRGVVVVSPPDDTQGFDQRELKILGGLVDDWPDEHIAAALGPTSLTVAEHVEQIGIKLAAPTRIAATLRAIRQGLYIPSAIGLSEPARGGRRAGGPPPSPGDG